MLISGIQNEVSNNLMLNRSILRARRKQNNIYSRLDQFGWTNRIIVTMDEKQKGSKINGSMDEYKDIFGRRISRCNSEASRVELIPMHWRNDIPRRGLGKPIEFICGYDNNICLTLSAY